MIFPQRWSIKTLEVFQNLYLQLYPVSAARKKILFELVKIFSLPHIDSKCLGIFSDMFFQYSQMQEALFELFDSKKVKPIACYDMKA